ncbi:MAG TPA: NAD(P)/FAD-dependent oxidoreductase [Candidatus Dojkabacteria bacterium]|nr:NAD(P)/FAD-dependent oxidoreductase [Candidatus Dojkabacteria bacterium]
MDKRIYDTIIIGGGAAGLMASVECKRLGQDILVIERNPRPGKKIAITGKGRCNVTTLNHDLRDLISRYQRNGKFLYGAFSRFSVQDTLDYFEKTLKVKLKIERGNRVFPKSDSAVDIIYGLQEEIIDDILPNTSVLSFNMEGNSIRSVVTYKGEFQAKRYILATGGKSYPITGSNGDGYALAQSVGHSIVEPKPALVPVICKERWIKKLEGLSLVNVKITAFQKEKEITSKFGEALFTHQGMTGPIVIDMSRYIGDALEKGEVQLSIDFKPALSREKLDRRVREDFQIYRNKVFKNSLKKLLPSSLIPVFLDLCGIDLEKKVAEISKEERIKVVNLLKDFRITPIKLDDWDKAIVTAGGVNIKEIDPTTMKSKIVDNLYFAGEIIDVYGPTGGYNLQICWSTGILAARS